jgi:1,4-dihydroxy-2-naphthoate octaprenyltransferase
LTRTTQLARFTTLIRARGPFRRLPLAAWIQGMRLLALLISLSSAVAGCALAHLTDPTWDRTQHIAAVLCVVTAVFVQLGSNLADDLADGMNGFDEGRGFGQGAPRTGSGIRLVASGVNPRVVLSLALVSWLIAAICGITVCAITSRWALLIVGALSFAAGWMYECPPLRFGYHGWGEVVVFLFFGPVCVWGCQYAITGIVIGEAREVRACAILSAVSLGLISCVPLLVNNIRDRSSDLVNHKMTLSTRIGDTASRVVALSCAIVSDLCVLAGSVIRASTVGLVISFILLVCGAIQPIGRAHRPAQYRSAFILSCLSCALTALGWVAVV